MKLSRLRNSTYCCEHVFVESQDEASPNRQQVLLKYVIKGDDMLDLAVECLVPNAQPVEPVRNFAAQKPSFNAIVRLAP